MARKTKVVLICDKHRGEVEAEGSVEVEIDGKRRRLDLCAEHMAELRRAMRPWLRETASASTAARSKRKTSKAAAKRRPRRSPDAAEVRAWAIKKGYDLPSRGRIPNAVREAYAARR